MSGIPRIFERPIQFGALGAAGDGGTGVLIGGGEEANPIVVSAADKRFISLFTKSEATSGDSRGIYWQHFLSAAGQMGECARFVGRVTVAGVVGANGVHSTARIDAAATTGITGLSCGVRATLEAEAASRSLTGTLCALQVDSYVGAGNTLPATTSFVRVSDEGAVSLAYLFEIATTGCLKGSACGTSGQDAIKLRVNGTDRYIALFNAS